MALFRRGSVGGGAKRWWSRTSGAFLRADLVAKVFQVRVRLVDPCPRTSMNQGRAAYFTRIIALCRVLFIASNTEYGNSLKIRSPSNTERILL